MKYLLLVLAFMASPALAQDTVLDFNPAKLCEWQLANNSMKVEDCMKLEDEAKAALPALEEKVDAKLRTDCLAKVSGYAKDPGFASYTLYASCLNDGPDSL